MTDHTPWCERCGVIQSEHARLEPDLCPVFQQGTADPVVINLPTSIYMVVQ